MQQKWRAEPNICWPLQLQKFGSIFHPKYFPKVNIRKLPQKWHQMSSKPSQKYLYRQFVKRPTNVGLSSQRYKWYHPTNVGLSSQRYIKVFFFSSLILMGGMFEKWTAGFLYFLGNFDWSVNFICPLCKILLPEIDGTWHIYAPRWPLFHTNFRFSLQQSIPPIFCLSKPLNHIKWPNMGTNSPNLAHVFFFFFFFFFFL